MVSSIFGLKWCHHYLVNESLLIRTPVTTSWWTASGSRKLSILALGRVRMLSCFSCVWLFATLWIVACQAPLSLGIFQARILRWVASPPPGELPDPRIEPVPPALQADSLLLSHWRSPALNCCDKPLLTFILYNFTHLCYNLSKVRLPS